VEGGITAAQAPYNPDFEPACRFMDKKVISVILNTNRRQDTLAALESLQQNEYPNHEIIVLDNASSDGSVEAIRSAYPLVQIIEIKQNLGYAGNNNVGIRAALQAGAEWVLVLNEDTILAPDCLSQLVRAGEQDERVGIVGPMVYHFDHPEIIQSAGGFMSAVWDSWHAGQNETDTGQFPAPRLVDWISGCAIMVRRAVIEEVGMLDERFFYYFEETEWCMRARRRGWKVLHVPLAKLWHKGVQLDYHPGPNVTYYATRNRFLMLSKHKAPLRAWVGTWLEMVRRLASWSVRPKWRARREHRNALWQGMMDFLMHRWGIRAN